MQEERSKYDDHYGKTAKVAVPKGLAEHRWGGADKLAAAVARGEVQTYVGEDNVTYCSWSEHEVGNVSGKRTATAASASKKLTGEQMQGLTSALDKLSWDFDIRPSQANVQLTADAMPAKAQEKVVEALGALRKASVDSKAILAKLQDLRPKSSAAVSSVAEFQSCLRQLLEHVNKLSHIESFGTYPNGGQLTLSGLKVDLAAGADALVAMYEANEIAKTFLRLG